MQTMLESELGALDVCVTEHRLHAVELTRQALKSGAESVVAIGGDGMLNEVVNGFFEHGQPLNHSATLAFFSRGTGSDFARSWEWTCSFQEFVQELRRNVSQNCDVIRIRLSSLHGAPEERYCLNMADVGIGGLVVEMVNRRPKVLGGDLQLLNCRDSGCVDPQKFPLSART